MESFERYSRQIQLSEIGISGQQKLAESKVLIIGMGGLGCSTAQHLVAAGVGTVGLLDYDLVDISNLNRQILYTEMDVGQPKVEVAGRALRKLNDQVQIKAYFDQLSFDRAMSLFPSYDIIIDGTDNFQTKYMINDACVLTGEPWVYASVYKYQGQLSVFNYIDGPTYRCLYPNISSENINCEEIGVLGALPGVLGTFQAVEALKIILEIGQVLSGRLLILDLLTMQEQLISFSRNEDQVELAKNNHNVIEDEKVNFEVCGKVYLDIREWVESTVDHDNNIIHIPFNQLNKRHVEIPRDVPIHVYCLAGIQSREAIKLLSEKHGFQNLINVNGGIQSLLQ
jgi:molybdopterin/thiamine biosynthesis adenylyltransferase/rhodanese-related sulfurtransferase